MTTPAPGHIFTFYSYKGGTGRSMALANIAWILAAAGNRVLMIDWDLEAPGLHRYFRPFIIDHELASSDGLIELVDRYTTEAIRPAEADPLEANWYLPFADFSDYVLSIDYAGFPAGARLDLLPAGRQGEAYAIKVSSFNWQNFYDRLGGGGFFEAVKAHARREYDYILIDSRTGVSDTAGICSVQMPDTLVVCFTYNNQSIRGASTVAHSATARRIQLEMEQRARRQEAAREQPSVIEDSARPYRIFPVPMRVERGESDRLELRQAFARTEFGAFVEDVPDSMAYWTDVEVPHEPFYAYEEVLSPFKDDARDHKTVLAAFARICGRITMGAVAEYRLPLAPEERREMLDRFAETPLTARNRAVLAESRKETEEQALVRTAETAMAGFSADERAAVQRVFGRLIRIGPTEEGGGLFPIRAAISDFTDVERHAIAALERAGVLVIATATRPPGTVSSAQPEQSVSLADERLLRLWTLPGQWLEGDREFLTWRQRLRGYLSDWLASERDPGALLSGRLLGEAKYWRHRRPDELNAAEQEYLGQSQAGERGEVSPPPPTVSDKAASPARTSSPLPLLLRLAAGAAIVMLAGYSYWLTKSSVAPEVSDAIAAANAASDPLQKLLLLLEVGESASVPASARDLAFELFDARVPYIVLRSSANVPVTVGRFSTDGRTLITGSNDGQVRLWGSNVPELELSTGVSAVRGMAFDRAAGLLLVGGMKGAELWDVKQNRRIQTIAVKNPTWLTLSQGRAVTVERVGTGARVLVHPLAETSSVAQVLTDIEAPAVVDAAFNIGGSSAAVLTSNAVLGWALRSGETRISRVEISSVMSQASLYDAHLRVSANGSHAAVRTASGVFVWQVGASARESDSSFSFFPRRVTRGQLDDSIRVLQPAPFAVSADGQFVALATGLSVELMQTGQASGPPRSERLTDERTTSEITSDTTVLDLDFSPDGAYVAASSVDGASRLWPAGMTARSRPSTSAPWDELWRRLREKTTACLTVEERTERLRETAEVATARVGECTAQWGPKSLAPPTTRAPTAN